VATGSHGALAPAILISKVWSSSSRSTVIEPSSGGHTSDEDEAWSLANHWVAAWNAHDLDLIMTPL